MKRTRPVIGILGAANLVGAVVGLMVCSLGYASAYSSTVAMASQLSPDMAPGTPGYETLRVEAFRTIGHSNCGKLVFVGIPACTGVILIVIAAASGVAAGDRQGAASDPRSRR